MPTEPLQRLLDRDFHKVEAAPVIDVACSLLREIVNYGTNVFGRCEQSVRHAKVQNIHVEGHYVILLLYLHVVEMLDALEVLIAASVVIPSFLQLRSAFEAYLQLAWILKEDTRRRVYAYLVYDIHNRLKTYRSLDPSSAAGKQHQAMITKDKWASSMPFPQVPDLDAQIQNLEARLTELHFVEVNAAYNARQSWYTLFGGPKNIEQLAQKLDLPVWYDILYRQSSHTTHALHLIRNVRGMHMRVVRDPSRIPDVVCMAVQLGIYATENILDFYRPGEVVKFWEWHQREISEPDTWLSQQP